MTQQDASLYWLKIAAVVMAFFIVLNVVSFVWFPFLPWFEQRQAGEEVVRDQIDAEKAVQEYEWFRSQYHQIQEQRAIVQNTYEEHEQFHETYGDDPNEWSRQAEKRHGRIHTRLTGNKNHLENLVSEYNARSDMANREMFKCHLPYQVDERFAIRGPPGSGDAEQPVDTGPDGETVDGEVPPGEQCDGLPDDIQQGGNQS